MGAPPPVSTASNLPESIATVFSRAQIAHLLLQLGARRSWRIFTPVVVVWALVLQRLSADRTSDAIVSLLHAGAADHLDPDDPHPVPLSKRIRSQSTAAFAQARARTPLGLLTALLHHVATLLAAGLPERARTWHGHPVRLLDGTTFRLRPFGDLAASYGHASNSRGTSYWVLVRSVTTCCPFTRAITAYAEASSHTSETALARTLMAQHAPGTLFVADRLYGTYRLVQVARALQMHVVLRLQDRTAALLLRQHGRASLRPGLDRTLWWWPTPRACSDPDLPRTPVVGRLIVVRCQRPGFRPLILLLWTDLLNRATYPASELAALYGERWKAELVYRDCKHALGMEAFAVRSAAMFRLELAAGLLAYSVVGAWLVAGAQRERGSPWGFSFQRARRRLVASGLLLSQGWPRVSHQREALVRQVLGCRVVAQPAKVQHEPRRVRRRPEVYRALLGNRDSARQEVVNRWLVI